MNDGHRQPQNAIRASWLRRDGDYCRCGGVALRRQSDGRHWFTPIVWTGYILFVDALVYKLKARSLLMNGRWFNYCCLTETVLSVYCFQGAHKRDKRLVTRGLVPKRILESFMQEQENEGSEKADRDCGLPAACALFFYGLISSDLEFNCSGMSFSLGNASPLYMKSDGCNANEIG